MSEPTGMPEGSGGAPRRRRPATPAALATAVAAILLVGGYPEAGAPGSGSGFGFRGRQDENREYEIKAAFLKNFLTFTEWPDEALPKRGTKVVIGLLGKDDFGKRLDVLADKEVKDRKIGVVRFARPEDVRDCHLLFVSRSLGAETAAALKPIRGRPILTVGEGPEFLSQGGIIGLVVRENKVKFEVDARAAQASGLKVSSRLLDLAVRVVKDG